MSQVQSTRSALAKLKAGATTQDIRNAQLAISKDRISLANARLAQSNACGSVTSTSTTAQVNACTQAKNGVTAASYQITIDQNNLSKLRTPATAADLAAAQQSVTAAENNYNAAVAKFNDLRAQPTPAQLAAAQAQLATAQSGLAKAQTPYTDADLQSAKATVAQAQAGLDTAQASLDAATLKAPFDGIVSAVAVNVGEAPASPAITVVDPNALRLDTTVDESDISKLQIGQTVNVTFDSVPSSTFQGRVTSIAPTATIQSGVALYSVQVSLNSTPQSFAGAGNGTGTTRGFTGTPGANATPGANPNRRANATPAAGSVPVTGAAPAASATPAAAGPTPLKAGMTGNATIVYGDAQDVLLVPNNAVKTQGRSNSSGTW